MEIAAGVADALDMIANTKAAVVRLGFAEIRGLCHLLLDNRNYATNTPIFSRAISFRLSLCTK